MSLPLLKLKIINKGPGYFNKTEFVEIKSYDKDTNTWDYLEMEDTQYQVVGFPIQSPDGEYLNDIIIRPHLFYTHSKKHSDSITQHGSLAFQFKLLESVNGPLITNTSKTNKDKIVSIIKWLAMIRLICYEDIILDTKIINKKKKGVFNIKVADLENCDIYGIGLEPEDLQIFSNWFNKYLNYKLSKNKRELELGLNMDNDLFKSVCSYKTKSKVRPSLLATELHEILCDNSSNLKRNKAKNKTKKNKTNSMTYNGPVLRSKRNRK